MAGAICAQLIGFACVPICVASPWWWSYWNPDLISSDATNLDKLFFFSVAPLSVCICALNVRRDKHIESMMLFCCSAFFSVTRPIVHFPSRSFIMLLFFCVSPSLYAAAFASLEHELRYLFTEAKCLETGCYQTQSHQRLSTFSK